MSAKFEIVHDDQDRFRFRLLDAADQVLLTGLPSAGKIAVQYEVQHARSAIRSGDRFVPHTAEDGRRFLVLKKRDGSILARGPQVADDAALQLRIDLIRAAADAPLLDRARA